MLPDQDTGDNDKLLANPYLQWLSFFFLNPLLLHPQICHFKLCGQTTPTPIFPHRRQSPDYVRTLTVQCYLFALLHSIFVSGRSLLQREGCLLWWRRPRQPRCSLTADAPFTLRVHSPQSVTAAVYTSVSTSPPKLLLSKGWKKKFHRVHSVAEK